MTETPQSYPLAWPAGKPRTPAGRRQVARFNSGGYKLSISYGTGRVQREVERLGGRWLIVSSNVEVRRDGLPYSGRKAPEDPGVCIYFQLDGKPYAMACDRYTTVADNLAAIAAHIDATRAIARYGVASAAETLQAFQALPNPDQPKKWRDVLGDHGKPAEVAAAFRRLSAERHPDKPGGSHDAMAELTRARDEALKELS